MVKRLEKKRKKEGKHRRRKNRCLGRAAGAKKQEKEQKEGKNGIFSIFSAAQFLRKALFIRIALIVSYYCVYFSNTVTTAAYLERCARNEM